MCILHALRREAHDDRLGDYWVQYDPANLVDWGDFRAPETFTAGFPREPLQVLIEIVLDDDGPKCVAISRLDYEAPALTSERRFPIRAMVSAAVRAATFELVDVPIEQVDPEGKNRRLVPDERGHVRVYAPAFPDAMEGATETQAQLDSETLGPRRRSPPESDDLRRVAELYRRAVVSGAAPSHAIAAEFGITRETARKWVQRARERGFLGAALGRRPGEVRPVPRSRRRVSRNG
jgi:Helix-turn-helix domain